MSNKLLSEQANIGTQYDTQILTHSSSNNVEQKTLLERSEDEPVYLGHFSRFSKTLHRGFDMGSFGLVLEPTALYEIIESAKISPMPGTNSTFKGLVNHRSNVAPVYDITKLLDNDSDQTQPWERQRLLILGTGNEAIGIIIYELPVQIKSDYRVHPEDLQDIPSIFQRHAKSAYLNNEKLWLNLDYENFFNELTNKNSSSEQVTTP